MNILELLKPLIAQTLVQKAASWLGESESGVGKALQAALPTLIALLLNNSGNKSVMGSISQLMGSSDLQPDALLADPTSLFSSSVHSSPVGQLGGKFLESLLGDKVSGLAQSLSQHSGIGVGSATKLLGGAAPLLMAFLSKQGASAGGLSGFLGALNSQKSALMSMVPGPIGAMLGMDTHASAGANFSANRSAAASEKGGFPWMVLPVLALLGAAGYWFFKPKAAPETPVDSGVTSVAVPAGPQVIEMQPAPTPGSVGLQDPSVAMSETVSDPTSLFKELGETTEKTLPGDIKLSIPANGIESKLVAFIEDATQAVDKAAWFNFDRILFDTAKASLRSESNEQISNIAMILKAFPSVQLKIGGYTDNQGDVKQNLQLSADRANSVMSAIVAQGIDAARLKAEGYGQEHPVADNNSDAGRQMNRRVSARITAK